MLASDTCPLTWVQFGFQNIVKANKLVDIPTKTFLNPNLTPDDLYDGARTMHCAYEVRKLTEQVMESHDTTRSTLAQKRAAELKGRCGQLDEYTASIVQPFYSKVESSIM